MKTLSYDEIKKIVLPIPEDEAIHFIYQNKITLEKIYICEFICYALIEKIYETYLGDEFINNIEDKKKHFEWCFNKVSQDIYDKKVNIELNKLKEHLWNDIFKDNFYLTNDKWTEEDFAIYFTFLRGVNEKKYSKLQLLSLKEISLYI